MLNEERKRIFLEREKMSGYTPESSGNIKYTLQSFGKHEELIGKDICDWSITDIRECFILRNTTSTNVLRNIKSQLSEYTDWCINHRLSQINQNNWENVTESLLKVCINTGLAKKQLIPRDELLDRLDDLLNDRDKFLILGLYEGMTTKELFSAKKEDINGNVMSLSSGRKFVISDELKAFAERSAVATEYYIKKSNNVHVDAAVFKRADGDDRIAWIVNYRLNTERKDTKRNTELRLIKRASTAIGYPTMTALKYNRAGRVDYIRHKIGQDDITIYEYEVQHVNEIDAIYGAMSPTTRADYLKVLKELDFIE